MRRVDLVGVDIIKNVLSVTGGPGGRPSPLGPGIKIAGCRWTISAENVHITTLYRPLE